MTDTIPKQEDAVKCDSKERLATCIECEDWVQGKVLDYCGKCKCATSGKVFSPVGGKACPMGKWIR